MRITVLIALKNGLPLIDEALLSLLIQTEKNFRIVVVDDNSTDKSIEFIKNINDERIKIIKNKGDGIADALNTGLEQIDTDYVAIMDSDDICYPDRLEIQKKFLDSNPNISLVGTSVNFFGSDINRLWKIKMPSDHKSIIKGLQNGNFVLAHSTVMIRTDQLKKIGGYRKNAYPNIDLDMFLRISEYGQLANLSDNFHYVRIHKYSFTQKNLKMIVEQSYKLKKYKNNFDKLNKCDYLNIVIQYLSLKFYKKGLIQYLNNVKMVWLFNFIIAGLLNPFKIINHLYKKA